jgi:N-methylhydantoinase A
VSLTVGVDVGGTFTDVFVHDARTGHFVVHKVPSTPPAFEVGFMRGVLETVEKAGAEPRQIGRVIHGTTVATNCILTRSGARLGLLMTEGFRDVLYIGVGWRPRMYDLDMDAVEPLFLAPRRQALGVRERVDVTGAVVQPLDEGHLLDVARQLVEGHGVQVFVVCFLHSYANPSHERRAREVLRQAYPDIPVSLSSDVLPRRREYRRLVVSAFDGYVKPVVTNYIRGLSRQLKAAGIQAPLHIMLSNGGVCGMENVIERPVRTVLSGLAAGVIGAAEVGAAAGFGDAVSVDMGGTSTDVALIRGGRALMSMEGKFEDYPLNLPMVDVRTIGAGGSSLAYVDKGGALKVGPESAGAMPGPACYGRGGTVPTVTDASFVLGFLAPETFAGGIDIDLQRSRDAIKEKIARPLGLSVLEAALGIHAIVNSNMAQTIRLVSIKRGFDPRELTLIPLGGAGPLHAGRLAEATGMQRILVPPTPGVLSALGLSLAPIQHEGIASFETLAERTTAMAIRKVVASLDADCHRRLMADAVDPGSAKAEYLAQMRYAGQSHELEVSLGGTITDDVVERATAAFHQAHEAAYSHADRKAVTEFVALRAVHTCAMPGGGLAGMRRPTSAGRPVARHRAICLDATRGLEEVPVYDRATLPAGFSLTGPAVVEQSDTTTLVYPEHRARVDELGNIVIDV